MKNYFSGSGKYLRLLIGAANGETSEFGCERLSKLFFMIGFPDGSTAGILKLSKELFAFSVGVGATEVPGFFVPNKIKNIKTAAKKITQTAAAKTKTFLFFTFSNDSFIIFIAIILPKKRHNCFA